MDERKPVEDMTDNGRNELTDYLDAIERDGHAELAEILRRARNEYMRVSPLYVNGKPSGLLEIRYNRRFKTVRLNGGGDREMLLGDDYNYIYEDEPIDEAELRAFSVDRESFQNALQKTLDAGKTADEMDWSDVKITLTPYVNEGGKPVLYTDMLFTIAVAAPMENGDNERAGHFLDLLAAWDGGKEWLDARRSASKERKTAKGTTYLRDKSVMVTTDQIAGALFDPSRKDYIDPASWWDETPKPVRTAKYGVVALQPRLPVGIDMEDDPDTYKLTARQRFWYETAEKLAREGYRTIRGSDLLKKSGYKNPYKPTTKGVMRDAARALLDLTGRRVAIDTTDQYSKKRRDGMSLRQQITLRPIIDGEYSFTSWDGGGGEDVKDFEIELRGSDPVQAFALLEYQLEHKMFADIPGHDDCLDGMSKLTIENRYMWREVRRRMLEKNLPGDGAHGERRIRFDALFKALGMDGETRADEARRRRMIDTLEKMLRRACRDEHRQGSKPVKHTQLFKKWDYITDANGRRYGVVITPL